MGFIDPYFVHDQKIKNQKLKFSLKLQKKDSFHLTKTTKKFSSTYQPSK